MRAVAERVYEQVEVAIAIDVGEDRAGGIQEGGFGKCGVGDVFKLPLAEVLVEAAAVVESGEEQVAPPIAIDITGSHAGAVEEDLVCEVTVQSEEIGEVNSSG